MGNHYRFEDWYVLAFDQISDFQIDAILQQHPQYYKLLSAEWIYLMKI